MGSGGTKKGGFLGAPIPPSPSPFNTTGMQARGTMTRPCAAIPLRRALFKTGQQKSHPYPRITMNQNLFILLINLRSMDNNQF